MNRVIRVIDTAALRSSRSRKVAPDLTGMVLSAVRPLMPSPKHKLSDLIKGLIFKIEKALQGDHEFHKYLGM